LFACISSEKIVRGKLVSRDAISYVLRQNKREREGARVCKRPSERGDMRGTKIVCVYVCVREREKGNREHNDKVDADIGRASNEAEKK
jgi:hypothetical protein